MDRDSFTLLLDDSLVNFRRQLLQNAFEKNEGSRDRGPTSRPRSTSGNSSHSNGHGYGGRGVTGSKTGSSAGAIVSARDSHSLKALPRGGRGADIYKPNIESPRQEASADAGSTAVTFKGRKEEEGLRFTVQSDPTASGHSGNSLNSGASDGSEGIPVVPGLSPNQPAPYLRSRLEGLSPEEQKAIRRRLRLRLGALSSTKLVSGSSLYDAIRALGLTRYTLEEMNDIVNLLAAFIGLQFDQTENRYSLNAALNMVQEEFQKFGTPYWQWPPYRDSTLSHGSLQRGATTMNVWSEKQAREQYNVVPAQALMELFLAEEGDIHKRIFGSRLLKTFHAIREILLAGDTNRLVAELTFVRINDLAAPPEPMHPLVLLEPFVAFLIVLNGIMIGFQTDPKYGDWEGWPYFEIGFACFLVLEILTRMHLLGCGGFWCGPELMWNYFDLFLAGTGLVDIIVQQTSNEKSGIFGTSLLRFCRLIRLVRIVKIFRLKAMRDLRLMVKGLIAGIKTLVLAFTLLFSVLYVISGFATMTLGSYDETVALGLMIYFQSLPDSMFTAFRCFTGECVNEAGEPLTHLLAREYGLVFILSYVMSYMLVTMGIFNVILAVYVDITMKAAKENEAQTAEQHFRESIRIARTTRELLKKFAAAYHLYQDLEKNSSSNMETFEIRASAALFTDDELQENIEITKELFLLVIQDRDVQLLMDDLDLPPDRANLFEIIDADSSGTLHIAELVHGLLKIRGEVNKSDTIATLLATKAVQNMLTETKCQVLNNLDDLKTELLGLIFEQQVKLRKAIAATVSSPETGSSLSDSPRRGRSGGRSGSPGVIRSNLDSRGGRTAAMSAMPLGRMKAPQKPEVAEDSDAVPIPPEE